MMRIRVLKTALAALYLSSLGPAHAGDGAALNVLGFSSDGRYFAFEQFGEQDGSGTLFATITAIEVAGDRLVKGTPVSGALNPEEAGRNQDPRDKLLAAVRAKVALEVAPIINTLRISEAGRRVVALPKSRARDILDSEHVKAVQAAAIKSLLLPAKTFGSNMRLVLREFDIALPRCKNLVSGDHPNGIGLTLERKGRPTIHLRHDQTIPASRRCPDHYGIAEVHALPLPDGSTALAVLIQYFYQSFEGPDRRFMAVTGRVR
jgi:predicted secreted protein